MFTLAVMALVVAALINSTDWPAKAQLVPRTACFAALIAAGLNLLTELFGADRLVATVEKEGPKRSEHRDPVDEMDVKLVLRRAAGYFGWLAGFIALAAVIGLVPAIAVFIFAFMHFNFGESWRRAAVLSACTTLFAYVVFDRGLAVPWPTAVIGDLFPALRAATGLV